MKLIGAGFGRTGTTSLKAALEELGLGPCHHMSEVFAKPSQIRYWGAAARGEPVDLREALAGYESCVDWPAAGFYKELMALHPDAKVLLSVRDFDSWYQSCLETIFEISNGFPMRLSLRFVPVFGPIIAMTDRLVWRDIFHGRFRDKEYAREIFHRYHDDVKRSVPAERLLVYEVKEGWEPLCRFLGVPVPDKPFPRLNDTREFKKRVLVARVISSLALALPLAGAALLLGRRRR